MSKRKKLLLFPLGILVLLVVAAFALVGVSALFGEDTASKTEQGAKAGDAVVPKGEEFDNEKDEMQQAVDAFATTAKRHVVQNTLGGKDIYYTFKNDSTYTFANVFVEVKGSDENDVTIETGIGSAQNVQPGETVQIQVIFTEMGNITKLGQPLVNVDFGRE